MDYRNHITKKQYTALLFLALLSPLMRILPRGAVRWAGPAAWLCPLLAVPMILALAWVTESLHRGMAPGEGLSPLLLRVLGPAAGRALLLLYAGGLIIYAGFVLRSGGERFAATVYQQSRPEPFMLLLLALCLAAAFGTGKALGRMAVILRGILVPVLAAVFLLTAPNVSGKNLLPAADWSVPGILLGALPVFPMACVGTLLVFLGDCSAPEGKSVRRSLPAVALSVVVGSLLCLETVGVFGPKLTARLSYPFFTMTRDISLSHLAQRVEAVVVALWVFSDFILCALLLRCVNTTVRALIPRGQGKWVLWPEAAAIYLCGHFVGTSTVQALLWQDKIVPLGLSILVPGGYLLTLLVGKLRKQI